MRSLHYVYLLAAIPLLFPTLPVYGQDEAAPAVQCIEGGEGYLHVTLTGALNVRVYWGNDGMECDGTAKDDGLEFYFDRKVVEGMGGAGLYVTMRPFGVEPGELGTSLSVILTIESNAFAGRIYRTTAGNCRINVSKNEVVQSLGIAKQYQIEGVGRCSEPATAPGGAPLRLSDFEFSGSYAAISFGG